MVTGNLHYVHLLITIINEVFTYISANENPTRRIIALPINNVILEVYIGITI